MATRLTANNRQSYTISEKLKIIKFAEQNGNRAVECEFAISDSNIRLWRQETENIERH